MPEKWRLALRRLAAARLPKGVSAERWSQIIADGQAFVDRWGGVCEDLGWRIPEVFCFHPEYDDVGLAIQLRGRPVVAMAAGEAVVDLGGRRWAILRPHLPDNSFLLWRFDSDGWAP